METGNMAVYLIHFEKPIGNLSNPRGQARHYIGYSAELASRLAAHQKGNGSALMAAVHRAGIEWEVARIWPEGDRALERQLKRQKNAWRFCPICRAERQAKTK